MSKKTYTFTPEQIEILFRDEYDYEEDQEEQVEGYEGWHISADEETGSYDGSKSSMIDYEIYLYNEKGKFMGEAEGGYYNGNVGHSFSFELTFIPPKPPSKKEKFNNFLADIAEDEDLSLNKKIAKVKKHIEALA